MADIKKSAEALEVGDKITLNVDSKEDQAILIAFDKSVDGKDSLDEKIKRIVRQYIQNDPYLSQNLLSARRKLGLVE